MIRGIRGATTVQKNEEKEMLEETKKMIEQMAVVNQVSPDQIASVLISVTPDLDAAFPAKALRLINGWKYVPVMCMPEISVPGSLPQCIRVMMTVNTELGQEEVEHVYLNEAVKLRPDLADKA
ncbi:chorismate mutase [Gracilibacillus oryzae]|uniref:chorismate mutase n=1 Tax=Gracilibacillus oryzae TaxID=1672701 RepID=A0A7C8GVZ0_9BACI|nr:chorismate mutase [Gracilibacillus oryzae]KAB8138480.1 chorismate mutase [Gracilibacillus oryzae]